MERTLYQVSDGPVDSVAVPMQSGCLHGIASQCVDTSMCTIKEPMLLQEEALLESRLVWKTHGREIWGS